jgi:ankyrin repeat protein
MSKYYEQYSSLIKRIRQGETLPLKGTDWSMANGLGWTLAHEAAKLGRIPAGFRRDQWNEVDSFQNPVANIAAKAGTLPEDFEFWDIRDDNGNTPGHIAAINGKAWKLPVKFNAWDAKNGDGKTVRDLADEHEKLTATRMTEREERLTTRRNATPKMGM